MKQSIKTNFRERERRSHHSGSSLVGSPPSRCYMSLSSRCVTKVTESDYSWSSVTLYWYFGGQKHFSCGFKLVHQFSSEALMTLLTPLRAPLQSPTHPMISTVPIPGTKCAEQVWYIPLLLLNVPRFSRFSQYKMKTSVADQESRRARMLEHQKSKRDDLVRACLESL